MSVIKRDGSIVETTYSDKPENVFNAELGAEIVKRAERLKDQNIDLAVRVGEALLFLEWSCTHIRKSWTEWQLESLTALNEVRMTRMALDTETKQTLAACADVRKFFLSADHEKEIARLKEFIELCERLKKLKADGTLDALADTILKLA